MFIFQCILSWSDKKVRGLNEINTNVFYWHRLAVSRALNDMPKVNSSSTIDRMFEHLHSAAQSIWPRIQFHNMQKEKAKKLLFGYQSAVPLI